MRRTWVVDYRLSLGNHPGKVGFQVPLSLTRIPFFAFPACFVKACSCSPFPPQVPPFRHRSEFCRGFPFRPSFQSLSGFFPSGSAVVNRCLLATSERCTVPKNGISFLGFTGRSYFCPGFSSVRILLLRAGAGWFFNDLKNTGRTDPLPFVFALGKAFFQQPASVSVERQEEPKFHCFSPFVPAVVDGPVVVQRIDDVFNCEPGGSCRFPAEDLPQRPDKQMIRFQYHSHWMGDSRFPTGPLPLSEESDLPLGPTRARQK